jgi:4-hydroxy-3-polyprenylbenzoate decarboxylase
LREYIDALKALGEIQEIAAEVDWHLELGAIVRRSYELRAPAPLFERLKGIEAGFRVLGAPAGLSRQPGLAMCRLALSLGLPADSSAGALVEALADAHERPPLAPRLVADGPCKAHKLLGPDVDLYRLPAPLIHDGDGGRYLNTWGTVVVQTPDRRWTNWSISRMMLAGKNTLAGLVLPQQHLGIIFAQWQALGRPMPFALALGTEPVIPFVSGMPLADYVNEADFVGGYLGEPVDVVACETVDLQVPATAEIVLEGTVSVAETTAEGPMGEYSGYLNPGGGSSQPVFQVSAMTYRDRPILPVVAAGEPVEENHTCWGLAISAQVLWELRKHGWPVGRCFCPFESAGHWLVVTVKRSEVSKTSEVLVNELAQVLFHSRAGTLIPKIILLDDDVDPANLDEVVWALATRCHPERGPALFPNEPVLPLVGYLSAAERRERRSSKVIYNCLLPDGRTGERRPKRSSFRYAWPTEVRERVVKNWKAYGYED